MKTIKQKREIEEITGYEAFDGTMFGDSEQCRQYEKTAKCAIKARFNELVVNKLSEYEAFEGFGCGSEDYNLVVVDIRSEADLQAFNQYSAFVEGTENRCAKSDVIGHKLLVGIGYCDDWDTCYIYGTFEDVCAKFFAGMNNIFKITEE